MFAIICTRELYFTALQKTGLHACMFAHCIGSVACDGVFPVPVDCCTMSCFCWNSTDVSSAHVAGTPVSIRSVFHLRRQPVALMNFVLKYVLSCYPAFRCPMTM